MSQIGNTVARLLLGRWLRALREAEHLHCHDAATEAGVARATLWRMEKGDIRCRYRPGDVEILGRLYGANKDTIESLTELAKATRAHTWVGAYRDLLTPAQEAYLDLEAHATRIRCYAATLVPELLQTAGYAEALIRGSKLLRLYDAPKHTRIRMRRQEILVRDPQPVRFEFLFDETALRCPVGAPGVLAAQLRALVESAGLPQVSVRVVPHHDGTPLATGTGPFTILGFPSNASFGGLPTTVHVPHLDELLDRTTDVARYEQHWNDASAHALDQRDTLRLITDTIDQTETG